MSCRNVFAVLVFAGLLAGCDTYNAIRRDIGIDPRDPAPQQQMAQRHFSAGSWLMSFELHDLNAMIPALDRLRVITRATGMGDTRTLVIPVAPSIYWEAGPEVRASMNIGDGLVRMSVGLEEEEDLIADFEQALPR